MHGALFVAALYAHRRRSIQSCFPPCIATNGKLRSVCLEQSPHSDKVGRQEIYTSLRMRASERVSYAKHKIG